MGDSRGGMYEMQMDPCGLYGNQVNDDGWTGDGFFSRKEEYKHTERERERGRYGKEEIWCSCVEEVSTSVKLIDVPNPPLDGLHVSFSNWNKTCP